MVLRPYGFANFLNVSVSDHISGNAPRFYWQASHAIGTFGNLALPADAYDPDVVLIDNDVRICALIVYYSASKGGYCLSWSLFNTTGTPNFGPLATPMLIQSYVSTNDSLTCINIDSDNDGNYAIAYQVGNQSFCKTGILTAGSTPTPSVPANQTIYSDWIQPDVSLQHSLSTPNMKVKIAGLRQSRSAYKVAMRMLSTGAGPTYTSPAYAGFSLNNPRIASPLDNSTRFAITLMRNNPGSSTYDILFNSFTGASSTGLKILNAGAAGFPTAINTVANRFPAISYVDDIISVGWHTAYLPGSPAQTNTFVGLDLMDGSFMPVTPAQYLDICPGLNYNLPSVIAVSGRYTLWGKSAAYERVNVSKQSISELVWVVANTGTPNWRPSAPEQDSRPEMVKEFTLSPNPATDILTVNTPRSDVQYRYFVYDFSGKKVLDGTISNSKGVINIQSLANGTYFIRIAGAAEQPLNSLKFVKH